MRNRKTDRSVGVPLLERYAARIKALIAARRARASAASAFDGLEGARRHGQSETAAAILHIVRSLLNPLILGLGASSDGSSRPTVMQIGQAISELTEPSCDAERRAKLAQYLNLAFQQLTLHWDQQQARHVQLLHHIRKIETLLEEFDGISAIDRGAGHSRGYRPWRRMDRP